METAILGLYWSNGKENGNYYLGFRVKSKRTDSVCEAKLSNYPQPVARALSPVPEEPSCDAMVYSAESGLGDYHAVAQLTDSGC